MIILKTEDEIEQMRLPCRIVFTILEEMSEQVAPGISTADLDAYAERRCRELGVKPAFKGYQGFPASVCISVNDEVVHGIPSPKRVLKAGDIVGLDFGVVSKDGWFGDSARTVAVGEIDSSLRQLLEVTEKSLHNGIAQAVVGGRLFDIGHAIESTVKPYGYGIVREFVGHGIGRSLHEDPQVPNFGAKGKGLELREGMVLAIEPMITAGNRSVKVLADGWTAVTQDGSYAAHFEHTLAITASGPRILTQV